jgi:hypothetical protein
LVNICVVHHSPEIVDEECGMDLVLIAVIGGNRPPVSLVEVCRWIVKHFGIPGDSFQVRRYFPEDFTISPSSTTC